MTSPEVCAREILETVPAVMRMIRTEMRSCRAPGLSVPQFRGLVFVNRNAGVSLSEVAEYIGLTLPSTSKLVDGLVKRGLLAREESAADRRKITLALTPEGCRVLDEAIGCTQQTLTDRLNRLDEAERVTLLQAMQILNQSMVSE
jgi:DNA-binding MarR family transcriptional regulator